jgi:hypothetical protein
MKMRNLIKVSLIVAVLSGLSSCGGEDDSVVGVPPDTRGVTVKLSNIEISRKSNGEKITVDGLSEVSNNFSFTN